MRLFAFALLAAGSLAGTANASPIVNGGFEAGNFTGWSTLGITNVGGTTFTFAPPQGSFQAALQTAQPNGSASPLTENNSAALAAFLGVTQADLDALAPNGRPVGERVRGGSAIQQTFSVGSTTFTLAFGVVNQRDNLVNSALLIDDVALATNGTLSFRWNFLTDELDQDSSFRDYAFVAFNGQLVLLRDKNTGPFNNGPAGFDGNTGLQTFSQLFPQLAVPEPVSLCVFGGLLAAGGLVARRRMKVA